MVNLADTWFPRGTNAIALFGAAPLGRSHFHRIKNAIAVPDWHITDICLKRQKAEGKR
ncbi:hypothetical protein [Allocoleopsis franciscana]|uniref:hypothetical protein n=1 Tax=Allocoleopsis franciscana TaxID=2886352 RepID=UPI0012DD1C18|nr:hypothetical protein [Allocoleopsis franciscana]